MELVHKLTHTRRGLIAVSAAAALIAGIIIVTYLNHYRASVQSEGAPVTVLIARSTIAKDTPASVIVSKHLYTTATLRESELRDGAIGDPSSLRGQVAKEEIYQGAQLTTGSFTAQKTSLAGTLSERQRLINLPLDPAHGLTGQLEAGNHVDVYAGFNVVPLNLDGTPVAGGQSRAVLRLIVPNVPVVAIGGKSGNLGSNTSNVSLRVNDRQAAELAFASDNGKIWLALRPSARARSSRPEIVTAETLLLGVKPLLVARTLEGRR